MKKNDEKKVFEWATEIMKATGKSFLVCLAKAWNVFQLVNAMQEGVVTFAYEKADGSLRMAKGTLQNIQSRIKGTGKECMKSMCYLDVESGNFRSFKVENLVTVNM